MPLYEYECEECHESLEALQRLNEAPYTICPHCGGPLRKKFSAPAIQFKGSGFYINDYAKKPASSSDSKETKSETKSETRTETKSEAKSESVAKSASSK